MSSIEDFSYEEMELIQCMADPLYYLKTYGKIFDADQGELSNFTPYPYQEKVIRRYDKNQNNIILKSRQCVPKGVCVDTPDGPKSIEDFVVGDKVYSYNIAKQKVEEDIVCDSWRSGHRQCVVIKMKDGRNVEVGENHPFYIKNKGWIKAKNINIDDEILDVKLGFGKEYASLNRINVLLNTNFLKKGLSLEVFSWNKESTSLLLNKIFSLYGNCFFEENGITKKVNLSIEFKSKILIEQIRFLLNKFSIKSCILNLKNKGFKLTIENKNSLYNFINHIGIYESIEKKCVDFILKNGCEKISYSIVKGVDFTDEKECFDISVKNNENFLINGLLVHNTGLSVTTAGFVAWSALFRHDQRILIIANDFNGAKRFLETVKVFVNETPSFLLPGAKLKDNQSELKFSNGSFIKAVSASPEAGRGESLTMLILDEAAFIENADQINMGAGLAISRTGGKTIVISCVPKDTFVFTDEGIKEIGDFVDNKHEGGYEVDKYKVFGRDKLREGNLFFNNGFHDTKIIEGNNFSIEGTNNHKLWACKKGVYDWFEMEELSEGDYVSLQYGMECWGSNDDVSGFKPYVSSESNNYFSPHKISNDIAYLIGLYISSGSVYKKYLNDGELNNAITTIVCGDNISDSIKKVGLKYSCHNGFRYSIESLSFVEFLEYLGFDISNKSKEKEIPKRLMSMSRNNILYMLKGIFDGDGYSRKDKGLISISINSKKLIHQIRMLLLNFGVLTDYCEFKTKNNEKSKVETINYRISLNADYSNVFYEKIGFNFERKQLNEDILKKLNLNITDENDVIPFSINMFENMVLESGFKIKDFTKKGVYIDSVLNLNKKSKIDHINRNLFIEAFDICKEKLSNKTIKNIEKVLGHNLKWDKISKIKFSQKETYDFSLPDSDDFWAHSVLYNGVLGHQTPNGTGNYYYNTWQASVKGKNDFVRSVVHWKDNPYCSQGLEERITDNGTIRYWSPWYEKMCNQLHRDEVKIAQELDLSFEGSKATVISDVVRKYYAQKTSDTKPICFFNENEYKLGKDPFVKDKNTFWVYHKPVKDAQYIIACLPPGEKVLTDSGLKNIEEVRFEDKLVSKDGDYINIINKQKKQYKGSVYDIRVSNLCDTSTFTYNHPILSSNFSDKKYKFIDAEKVREGNWVVYPNLYRKNILNKNDILKKWDDNEFKNPLLDDDFWWYLGFWLSKDFGVEYFYKKNDIKYFSGKLNFLIKKYGFNSKLNSNKLFSFIKENFVEKNGDKKISEWIKRLPDSFKIKLIDGFLDGMGLEKNNIEIYSDNFNVLKGIQDILFSIGLISSLKFIESKKKYKIKTNKSKEKCLFSKDLNYIYFKVEKVIKKDYEGLVYNFETETHTFLTNNLTTHNCDVSRGDSKDYSTIQVFEAMNMIQVAEYHNKIDAHEFAHVIYAAAKTYNEAYVAIEFNNLGGATCYELQKTLGYKRMHMGQSEKDIWTGPRDKRWKVQENSKIPGIYTSGKNRPLIISTLIKYLAEKVVTLYSPRVVVEMETFVRKPNGKYEHEAGSNDDLLFALAIACYIKECVWEKALEGQNLYKAMLAGISYSNNLYSGKVSSEEKNKIKRKKKDLDEKIGGNLKPIYLSKDVNLDPEDDSDLSWLLDS